MGGFLEIRYLEMISYNDFNGIACIGQVVKLTRHFSRGRVLYDSDASHLSAVGAFHTDYQGVNSRTIQQAQW